MTTEPYILCKRSEKGKMGFTETVIYSSSLVWSVRDTSFSIYSNWGGREMCMAGEMDTGVGSTHPTGMHAC